MQEFDGRWDPDLPPRPELNETIGQVADRLPDWLVWR